MPAYVSIRSCMPADALSAFAYCLQVCMPGYVTMRMPAYVTIRSCMPAYAISAFAYCLQVGYGRVNNDVC